MQRSASQLMVSIDRFFDPSEYATLVDYAWSRESSFRKGLLFELETNTLVEHDFRRSRLMNPEPDFIEPFLQKIRSCVPVMCHQLMLPQFPIGSTDCDITAYNNGDYIRCHVDNYPGPIANRALSGVYYFFQEPKRFKGGELVFRDTFQGEETLRLTPRNNSITFFPSGIWHEVLPVSCESGEFRDSRFTINFWFRHADPEYGMRPDPYST